MVYSSAISSCRYRSPFAWSNYLWPYRTHLYPSFGAESGHFRSVIFSRHKMFFGSGLARWIDECFMQVIFSKTTDIILIKVEGLEVLLYNLKFKKCGEGLVKPLISIIIYFGSVWAYRSRTGLIMRAILLAWSSRKRQHNQFWRAH